MPYINRVYYVQIQKPVQHNNVLELLKMEPTTCETCYSNIKKEYILARQFQESKSFNILSRKLEVPWTKYCTCSYILVITVARMQYALLLKVLTPALMSSSKASGFSLFCCLYMHCVLYFCLVVDLLQASSPLIGSRCLPCIAMWRKDVVKPLSSGAILLQSADHIWFAGLTIHWYPIYFYFSSFALGGIL